MTRMTNLFMGVKMSKNRQNKRSNEKYQWIGHVQVYFTEKQKLECQARIDDLQSDLENLLITITQKGVSVKLTYDGYNDCYLVTLQSKDRTSKYYGYTLGFSHVEFPRLVQIAWYIVDVLMEHEGIELPNSSSVPDW
jgi:hypothetical protein